MRAPLCVCAQEDSTVGGGLTTSDRRSLFVSIFTLVLSVPALIGA